MLGQLARLLKIIKDWFRNQSKDEDLAQPSLDEPEYMPPLLTEDEKTLAAQLRQGDVVELLSVPIHGESIRYYPAPYGVVLLSQTCDAVRPNKLTVAVAPLARVDGDDAKAAIDNRHLRYIHVPGAGENIFADLHFIVTLEKAHFVRLSRMRGIDQSDDDQVRKFGRAIGRRFARFPFPDEVVYWLKPLEDTILKKYDGNGAEAQALQDVVEFRMEAIGGWGAKPLNLLLCVILKKGTLPTLPAQENEDPVIPEDLDLWLKGSRNTTRPASEVAERLSREKATNRSQEAIYWLWHALAEAWARQCVPNYRKVPADLQERVSTAVESIVPDLVETEDFSFERYRYSELVDLDHLSPPIPLV